MTVQTKNKTIEFDKVVVNFKDFVDKGIAFHGALAHIHHDQKYLISTDSHKLLRVNTDYVLDLPSQDVFMYDPKKKEMGDSSIQFPDTYRLIPDHFNITAEIKDLKQIEEAAKELKEIVKGVKNKVVTLKIDADGQTFITDNKEEMKKEIDLTFTSKPEEFSIHMNVVFLQKALKFAKKLDGLSQDPIEIKFVSNMRPFLISKGNIFDVILMPVRKY